MKNIALVLLFFTFLGSIFAQNDDFVINALLKGNPDNLNPILARSATAIDVLNNNIFVSLLVVNKDHQGLEPYLAVSKPQINSNAKGMSLSYEIRPEATWDDGSPITGHDVHFTLKASISPKVHNAPIRSFLSMLERVEVDPNNPRKFTVYYNEPSTFAEVFISTRTILPAYHYDKDSYLKRYTIQKLRKLAKEKEDKMPIEIIEFAESFNNNYNHTPHTICGAGPYRVIENNRDRNIKLQRKKNWWANNLTATQFTANPTTINFKVIYDDREAMFNLNTGKVDVITYVNKEQYLELQSNPPKNSKPISFKILPTYSYRYIGMNMRSPLLSDSKVRRALAHLVDVDKIINDFSDGLATRVLGPISPLKEHYNKNLKAIDFDPKKSMQLLNEAGWSDSDNDGVLDRVIKGKKTALRLHVIYPYGKTFYGEISLLLQEMGKEIGVDFVLMPSEWSVLLEDIKHRNFDLCIMGWGNAPGLDDLRQVWHSKSYENEGSNLIGFGTKKSDKIIDLIPRTLDKNKRNKLYHDIQDIIYKEQPYIFLMAPKSILAYSNKIKGNCFSNIRPLFHPRFCEKQ